MTRRERIQTVQEWLGDLATEADAAAVLDALEEAGYRILQEPERGYVLEPAMTEADFLAFADRALARPGGDDRPLTYRAAIYRHPVTGKEIALTTPAQAALPTDDLLEAAVEEARRAGLLGTEEHQVSEADFRARLYISTWVTR